MSKPKYTGIERRCQHTGSSCIHRSYPPQAFRSGPESATWADVREALAGLVALVLFGAAFWLWIAIAAAAQT